MYQQPTKAL